MFPASKFRLVSFKINATEGCYHPARVNNICIQISSLVLVRIHVVH